MGGNTQPSYNTFDREDMYYVHSTKVVSLMRINITGTTLFSHILTCRKFWQGGLIAKGLLLEEARNYVVLVGESCIYK